MTIDNHQPATDECTASVHVLTGAQSGVVLIQTDAGVVPQIYPATGQQPVYIAQQVTIDVT